MDVDVPARGWHDIAGRDRACDGGGPGRVRDDLVQRKGNSAWRGAASRVKVRDVAGVWCETGQLDGYGEGISAFDHRARARDRAAVLGQHREIDGVSRWWDRRIATAGDGDQSA